MKIKLTVTFFLIFMTIFLSCETNRSKINTANDLMVIAKESSQGIYLYVDNIPESTQYLSVSLYDITAKDELYTGTGFQGNKLEQIKKEGFVICPFVKNGHEYEIKVIAGIFTEENIKSINSAFITAIANGGIHIINNPTLVWDNSNNIITLSAKPEFSDEGINSQNAELGYGLVFNTGDMAGGITADYTELTHELVFNNTQHFGSVAEMIDNMGLNGDIPLYADVQLSLEFNETKWTLVFAKTDNVIYSF